MFSFSNLRFVGILMESSSLSRTSYSLRGSMCADNLVPTPLFQCHCCMVSPGHLWLPLCGHYSPTSPITWLFSLQGFLQRGPQWLSRDLISHRYIMQPFISQNLHPHIYFPPLLLQENSEIAWSQIASFNATYTAKASSPALACL